MKCERCNGRGWIYGVNQMRKSCYKCKGKGKLKRAKAGKPSLL